MALTRKLLSALGIEADKIEQIIEAHTDTVDGLKQQIAQYKADAEKLPEVQGDLDKLKETAKNGGDYAKLKKEFDDYKAEVAKKAVQESKKAVLTKIAKDAGLSDSGVAKAVKYSDLDKIELDENGEAKNAKDLIKSLKEEWSEYIQTKGTRGAETGNPPKGGGSSTVKTREEIYARDESGRFKLDAAERQAALSQLIAAEQQQKG